jgi:hypothetical protein
MDDITEHQVPGVLTLPLVLMISAPPYQQVVIGKGGDTEKAVT